jgi:cysteine desulfurase
LHVQQDQHAAQEFIRPSHVLMALGANEDEATSSLRFSISYTNTEDEIEKLASVIGDVVAKSRAATSKKVFSS